MSYDYNYGELDQNMTSNVTKMMSHAGMTFDDIYGKTGHEAMPIFAPALQRLTDPRFRKEFEALQHAEWGTHAQLCKAWAHLFVAMQMEPHHVFTFTC